MAYSSSPAKRPKFATLNGAFAAGSASLISDTQFENLFNRGTIAEFEDGDLVRCTDDYVAATSVAVQRAGETEGNFYPDLTATSHADGAGCEIDPPFTRTLIETLINEVLRNDLWPHVWTWHSASVTFITGETTYALADQYLLEVVRMYQHNTEGYEKFKFISRGHFEVEQQVNTAVDTNLATLRLLKVPDDDFVAYYDAKRRPHPDDLVNLSDEVADLIPWRVCAKLVEANIIPDRVDPPRRARQNSDGGFARDSRTFNAEFFQMRKGLNAKLKREIPEERLYVGNKRRRDW